MATNSSTETRWGLPVFGLDDYGSPTTLFYVIHGLALGSLGTSTAVSLALLIILLLTGERNLFKRPIGERLVVYLSVVDLCFSVSHMIDHIFMLVYKDHPPEVACRFIAAVVEFFVLVQAIVVMFTAFNAFYMVVREKKIELGKHDWRLLVGVSICPTIVDIVGVSMPFLGPSGPWCIVDMRQSWGPIVNSLMGGSLILVASWNSVFYGLVWGKISQAGKKMAAQKTDSQKKYHKLAKMMLMFVLVYMIQWWSRLVEGIWSLFGTPPGEIFFITVVFVNAGGVFNFIAYTVIRKKYQSPNNVKPDNVTTTNVSSIGKP